MVVDGVVEGSVDAPVASPAPMSLRAYARRRQTSAPSVLRAIRSGRLKASLVFDAAGKAQIADPDLADREWDRNTDLSKAPTYVKERAAARARQAPPAPAGNPVARPSPPPSARLVDPRSAPPPPASAPAPAPAPSPAITSDDEPEKDFRIHDGMTLTEASAAEKVARARLADLQYREKIGELVAARDVEARLRGVLAIIRTKLLAVPGKARAALPHLTLADVAVIERLQREALEDLASLGASPSSDGEAA